MRLRFRLRLRKERVRGRQIKIKIEIEGTKKHRIVVAKTLPLVYQYQWEGVCDTIRRHTIAVRYG
jgi:hypothetical protein